MDIKDIELYSDTDLIDELCKRYTHFVFSGRKDLDDKTCERRRSWSGNHEICIGLCQGVIGYIVKDLREEELEN